MEEVAGRMGAQELTQLERVGVCDGEGVRREACGWGPAGPSGGPVIGLGVLHLNSTTPERWLEQMKRCLLQPRRRCEGGHAFTKMAPVFH